MQVMLLSFAVSKIQQKMSLLCGNGQAVNGEGESLHEYACMCMRRGGALTLHLTRTVTTAY